MKKLQIAFERDRDFIFNDRTRLGLQEFVNIKPEEYRNYICRYDFLFYQDTIESLQGLAKRLLAEEVLYSSDWSYAWQICYLSQFLDEKHEYISEAWDKIYRCVNLLNPNHYTEKQINEFVTVIDHPDN